jgi:hypothetical protein
VAETEPMPGLDIDTPHWENPDVPPSGAENPEGVPVNEPVPDDPTLTDEE